VISYDSTTLVMRNTGDIVRKDNSGHLYFVGRKDSQVKRNGQRIDLEEINMVCASYEKQKITLYSIYMHFNQCVNSVDPEQLIHSCRLIRICTVYFLVKNNLINQIANIVDPDWPSCSYISLNF
jgi:acyl-CoA synthetase (AMP-forming)/AMP-acid ligase II